jgi:hypothetical protein
LPQAIIDAQGLLYSALGTESDANINFLEADSNIEVVARPIMNLILDTVRDEVGEDLQNAMNISPTIRAEIERLERSFIAAANVTVVTEVGALAMDSGISAGDVSVVGLAFSADRNEEIRINIQVLDKDDEFYEDSVADAYIGDDNIDTVQVSITVSVFDGETLRFIPDFDIPLVITLRIPNKIDPDDFIIIHYFSDGSDPEVLTPGRGRGNTTTFQVTSLSVFEFASVALAEENVGGNIGGGGSGAAGGGGRGRVGGGGGGAAPSAPAARNLPAVLTVPAAQAAVRAGLAQAEASGSANVIANARNVGRVPLEASQAMVAVVGDRALTFQADSMNFAGNMVEVRLSSNPAQITEPVNLYGSTSNTRTTTVKGFFERFFSNTVMIVSFEQQGTFGQPVRVAARAPAGFEPANLHFYNYNGETNSFAPIAAPEFRVDANGYVHFTTTRAGDIVISNGALARK